MKRRWTPLKIFFFCRSNIDPKIWLPFLFFSYRYKVQGQCIVVTQTSQTCVTCHTKQRYGNDVRLLNLFPPYFILVLYRPHGSIYIYIYISYSIIYRLGQGHSPTASVSELIYCTASLYKLAGGRKLAATHLNV